MSPLPPSEREARAEEVYARLFGPRDTSAPEKDPEFMRILRTQIFGDVFATGTLDDQTRELITCTVLASLQCLPQLKAHTAGALRVGVTPVRLREAIYQLAPFMGFPRTLNAIAAMNETFTAQGIELPLPPQGTTTDEDRLAKGAAIQEQVYGTEIKDGLKGLPDDLGEDLADMLTGFCFGDFCTRTGMDQAERELLLLVALATLGFDRQLVPHVAGAIKAGNSPETVTAALVQAMPYMGFPAAVNAVRVLQSHLAAS